MTAAASTSTTEPAASGRRRGVPVLPLTCGVVLVTVLVCGVLGGALAPHDPNAQDPLLNVTGPGDEHLLGTDQLGRDVLSRLLAGTGSSVFGPLMAAAGCVLIGTSLGMCGAYFGGVRDTAVNRLADLIYALPALLIAIVVIGVVGGGYWVTVAVLLFLSVPSQIRLSRSAAMVQVRLPYVDAARTAGISSWQIITKHVLPNVLPTVVATFLLDFVVTLGAFAALSFLGLGMSASTPSWGAMLADGQSLIATNPWLAIAPGILLIATGSAATLLGDWVHERLTSAGAQR